MKNLARTGVEARRRGNGYSYSFVDDAGYKRIARGRRLGEEYGPKALQERFEKQCGLLLSDPHAVARFARQLKEEQGRPLASWRQELRQRIREAASSATTFEVYSARLARQGMAVGREGQALIYTIVDADGRKHTMNDRELGAAYAEPRLLARMEDNAFRRACRLEVASALRGARSEEQYSARLSERGVKLERDPSGRFLYVFRNEDLTLRKVAGESLAPYLSTNRVELRLKSRGPNEAPSLTPSMLQGTSRQVGNLARVLTAEITRDSHAGYHQEHQPSHPERTKRKHRLEEDRDRP